MRAYAVVAQIYSVKKKKHIYEENSDGDTSGEIFLVNGKLIDMTYLKEGFFWILLKTIEKE